SSSAAARPAIAAGPGGLSMITATFTDAVLERELRELRAKAPSSVGFGALVATGVADRYAPVETPLGRAFVAWNGRGVSWVGQAPDGPTFESRFRAEVGRDIAPAD